MGPEEKISSTFKPAWWLGNCHAQTIFSALSTSQSKEVGLTSEIIELPDGDITLINWLTNSPNTRSGAPILIILHGLEGSSQSQYAKLLLNSAANQGWRAAVLHLRDCGGLDNKLPRRYHSGETNDLRFLINSLRSKNTKHDTKIVAAGFSLGGNILLKYLGEEGPNSGLNGAVGISVPLNLHHSAERLSKGFSKFYQFLFIKTIKKRLRRKFDQNTNAFDWQHMMSAKTFADIDDAVTAPLHGFSGKDEYYDLCSSINFLPQIRTPTLIINALDDPFTTPEAIVNATDIPECVEIELPLKGGHIGFINGGSPWKPTYYLPNRIIGFLDRHINYSLK